MKEIIFSGLAAALTVSVVGTLSTGHASQQSGSEFPKVAPATSLLAQAGEVESANPVPAVEEAERTDPETAKVGQQKSPVEEEVVAKLFEHQIGDRQAATVYLKNIPVVTFVGDTDTAEQPAEKVGEVESSEASIESAQSPSGRATELVAKLNQLELDGVEASSIKVSWNKERNSAEIKIDDAGLLELSSKKDVIFPQTTKDPAEDALQITNRLRRQLGGAEPLKDIANRPPKPQPKPVAVAPTSSGAGYPFQQGMASWYGPGFHGNLTANGERFNQYAMTAAHPSLAFGTRVRVTNLNNGRSVILRINDRGPYAHGRVIDLSQGAADVLGVSGVAPVAIDIMQ